MAQACRAAIGPDGSVSDPRRTLAQAERRLDVQGDIVLDIQRAQQHVAVELFRELSRKNPELGLERQLHGFRHACGELGLELPESVEALIVLDRQFTSGDAPSPASLGRMLAHDGTPDCS